MSRKNWKIGTTVSALARVLIAFAFASGQTAWALQGQNGSVKPVSNTAAKSEQMPPNPSRAAGTKGHLAEDAAIGESPSAQENAPGGGRHEGITVHGHWTVEVREATGVVVEHREFENSLFTGGNGDKLLSQLLSRQLSQGLWFILLFGSPQACVQAGAPFDCLIGEPGSLSAPPVPPSPSYQFETLKVSVSGNTLTFTGTAIAYQDGQIRSLSTNNNPCGPTFTGAAPCSYPGGNAFAAVAFTGVTLSTPISVSAGQTIAVTVNISFS